MTTQGNLRNNGERSMTQLAKVAAQPLISQGEIDDIQCIDLAVRTIHRDLTEAQGVDNTFRVALIQTRAIARLRQMLSDKLIDEFTELAGLPFGFMVDSNKDGSPKRYPRDVVRNCLIHALLYGLSPTGGEWGIIAGGMYITASGWEKLGGRLVNDLYIHLSVPEIKADEGVGLVAAHATFKVNGHEKTYRWAKGTTFDGRLCVRHNKGMMPTAVLTKARRQCLRQIASIVMGLDIPDDPIEPMGEAVRIEETGKPIPASGELFNDGK